MTAFLLSGGSTGLAKSFCMAGRVSTAPTKAARSALVWSTDFFSSAS
jgi:hypothetical protein